MAVKEELEKSMSTFGYQIIQTLVTDIEPDHKVSLIREWCSCTWYSSPRSKHIWP